MGFEVSPRILGPAFRMHGQARGPLSITSIKNFPKPSDWSTAGQDFNYSAFLGQRSGKTSIFFLESRHLAHGPRETKPQHTARA